MKTNVTTILVENPATYLFNKYRTAAVNHINCALDTIVANQGNSAAIMATADQMYEDLQQLRIIGVISEREYDAAAAITFEVLCGDNQHFVLPDVACIRDGDGKILYKLSECKSLVRTAIIESINKCFDFLINSTESEWREDGWETEDEYHKCIFRTVHNIMRLGKIISATTEKDHDKVTNHMKTCIETKKFTPMKLGD